VRGGILGFRRFDPRNNSERPAVFSLFRCFWAKAKSEIIPILTRASGLCVWFFRLEFVRQYRKNKFLSIK
jgi:hypothetical protein